MMGKSFILKDRSGTAAGYISTGIGVLRCRASGIREGMEAVLLYADGSHVSRLMDTAASEQEWKAEGGELAGGAIIGGGEIVADT